MQIHIIWTIKLIENQNIDIRTVECLVRNYEFTFSDLGQIPDLGLSEHEVESLQCFAKHADPRKEEKKAFSDSNLSAEANAETQDEINNKRKRETAATPAPAQAELAFAEATAMTTAISDQAKKALKRAVFFPTKEGRGHTAYLTFARKYFSVSAMPSQEQK